MSLPIAFTGSTTSGSKNVNSVSSIANLVVGQPITGSGIPSATTIASIGAPGTGTLTLSANATTTATGVSLTAALTGFTPFIATNIQNGVGAPLAAGVLRIRTTDASNIPLTVSSGGLGGQIAGVADVPITNGSVGPGIYLADTSLTRPQPSSFRLEVLDPQGRLITTYKGVQPTGETPFNFDTYMPLVPAQAPFTPVPGPQGPPGPSGSGSGNQLDETPAGTIDGTNVTFTLSHTPLALWLYRNGLKLKNTVDFSITGSTITFFTAPQPAVGDIPGDVLDALYIY